MFKITLGRGFQITFENGWTVSVQFGPYTYCLNRDYPLSANQSYTRANIDAGEHGCADAEVAWWPKDGDIIDDGDETTTTLRGYQTPAQVLAILNEVAAK